jgi:hypothetical protein
MSNAAGRVMEGVVVAFICFTVFGIVIGQYSANIGNTACDTSCKGFNVLLLAITFLGGSWGVGVAFGMFAPIGHNGRRG